MLVSFRLSTVLAFGVFLVGIWPLRSQPPDSLAPPLPFEDVGACPFEGCVYREWVANNIVALRVERRAGSSVAYTVKKGERVSALTGVVVTIKAGRVRFRETVNLGSASGTLHIEAGQTLFLLTYRGEGFTKAWFQGRLYEEVDGAMAFFNALCDKDPSRCTGTIVERPQSVWWVQIRNTRGQVGWTDQPGKFDGKDAFGN